jgi:Transmembrane exosortase (Exosortase_EpsH).
MNASKITRGFPLEAAGFGLLALLALAPLAEVWRQSPDLRHGWAAALLMAYLWWERSGERPPALEHPARASAWWWWAAGVLLVLATFPLRLLLVPFPLWTTVLWAYVGVIVGLGALAEWRRAGGAGVRWLLAPCILLASALPWPAVVEQTVILPLREAMASLAAEVCYWLGRPALAAGTTVRLASGWVGIDEACGGIRSLQGCVMIALFFGEWFRFTVWRRAVLLAAGVVSALVGNFGRVLFLALTAGRGGEQAVERLHDIAGWSALGLSLLVTALLACRGAGWKFPQMAPVVTRGDAPRALAPAVWLVAFSVVLGAGELGARAWFAKGERERAQVARWTVALPEAHRSFVAEPLGETAAEMLQPDAFRAGRWQEGAGIDAIDLSAYYVEWRTGQAARFIPFFHNPTVCLPLAGCELVGEIGEFDVDWMGSAIPFQAYRFSRRGEEMWVAFTIWDPSRGEPLRRPSDSFSFGRFWAERWREVTERRAHQPAQMLTLAIRGSREDPVEALRHRLVALLRNPR